MSAQPAGAAQPDADTVHALFFVTADSHPGLLPRLVEPFSKLGLTPHRVHASREDGDGHEISADLRIAGVSRRTAHLLEKALRSVIGVRSVIALVE